jgi:4-hydroxy-tetrahydrodipicolinate reductase
MATKVVINGAAGRMGRRITALLLQDNEMELAGALEVKGHGELERDVGILAGIGAVGIMVKDSLARVERDFDVVVDFSVPTSTAEIAPLLAERRRAVVIGTTGFSDEQRSRLQKVLAPVACVMAPNMSVGVNVLFRIAEEVTRILGKGWDVEILEAHHRLKADAPSGTALRLAEGVARVQGLNLASQAVYGRQGRPGPRTPEEIGILAVRAGDIVGEHTVMFGGLGERIELTHRAHTRDNFAYGALRAARWVVTQAPGLYDMMDVLGLTRP